MTPLTLGAGAVVSVIRETFATRGMLATLDIGHDLLPDAPDHRILAIAKKKATLRGFSDTGVTYHDVPCSECAGTGRLTAIGYSSASMIDCSSCSGDGFSPPARYGAR